MKFFSVIFLFFASIANAAEITGRFASPQGKVLIFAGQNNASVGGTADFRDGYVENVGIPGGISQYVHFSEGWTNEFGFSFPAGTVAGLNSTTDWGAGSMNLKAYLDSPMLDRCVIHLSISLAGGGEDKVADGSFDHLITEFTEFIASHQDHPFLIRIGYEFGAPGHNYNPENYRKAFRRIVDALRVDQLPNVAIVFAASTEVKAGQFEEFDPGSEYYDWIGYSWWGGESDGRYALEFARKVKKPVMITEATPLGHSFDKEDQESIWNNWFVRFFAHIDENLDVIRAASYINTDWDSREMSEGWGMTKIETAPEVLRRWREKMNLPMYINSVDKPFSLIGFPSPYVTPESAPVEPYAAYRDPESAVSVRVADLLGRMTLEEKIAQLSGWWDGDERTLRREGGLFTKEFYEKIAPLGIGTLGPVNVTIEEDIRQYNAIQEYFSRNTRLGIPALRLGEASHGVMRFEATSFPSPIAIACSWNPDLFEKIYRHIGAEASSRGISQLLCPNIDITRDLRWGRIDETLGEDPYLAGRLGAAMVRGLQGSEDGVIAAGRVAATVKHFAGFGAAEGGRNRAPYPGGRRQLLDAEIEPFRQIVNTAKPAAVMPGLNEVDGIPCHINHWLLHDVLRKELGYTGLVVGDYDALRIIREDNKIGRDHAQVAAMAFNAGVQIELGIGNENRYLSSLLEEKKVEVSQIDSAVGAVLDLKFRLGLFENPRLSFRKATQLTTADETRELAVEAARQSIVLLKNDGVLPLDRSVLKKIAVIGPNSDVCRLGSRSGTPKQTVSLLDGLTAYLGEDVEVVHAEGCMIALNDTHDSYLNWRYVNDVNFVSVENNQPLIDEAVAVAAQADVVILALGENMLLGREAWGGAHLGDRSTLDLTESQVKLAESIVATGKPVVLYLSHGRPLTLGKVGEKCRAILTGHYTGQETGTAASEILFGETNPSGKLTVSWPRSAGNLPAHYNRQRSSRLYDYIDSPLAAVYPFGHGLSYTTFTYSKPALSKESVSKGESVEVTFEVANTGPRAGTEIAQLYVSGEGFEMARPGLELKGHDRFTLEPGEARVVKINLEADDLCFHNAGFERVLPKGEYKVRVGGSSGSLSEPVILQTGPPETKIPIELTSVQSTKVSEMVPAEKEPPMEKPKDPVVIPEVSASLDLSPENLRQTIDGFGGSIAFWGTAADDEALQVAINGLNTNIIRAQGEVSPQGDPEHNRDVLQRAMKINPSLEILLTFWQPKSQKNQDTEYWLNKIEIDGEIQFELKPERESEWAFEMIRRIKQYREWGINVTTIGVQNESNWSQPGTQTCRWDPERLADFIENKIRPGLDASGMDGIKIAAPDLAFIGHRGSEIDRFIPVLTSPDVKIATYHMYDSYSDAMEDKSLTMLEKNGTILASLRNQYFPDKRLWMTETSGAQWNNAEWHTYGWSPDMSVHDKAIKAARYLHMTLVDAEANAFFWWGLVYSVAPETETNPKVIEKHLDEGLVLVEEKQTEGGQKILERTKKYYTFRQYSGFVKPGYRRVNAESPEGLQLSAFLSDDESMAVSIVINDTVEDRLLKLEGPEGMRVIGTFQTDESRNCSPVDVNSPLPSKSVRTMVFSK